VNNIDISFIFLIIGSIIGAGFSSGKEIVVFFSNAGKISYVIIILTFFLLYYSINAFIKFANLVSANNIYSLNKILFKKTYKFFNFFILAGLFIFISAMVAGLNSVGNIIFKNIRFPVLTIVSLFFSFFISLNGYSAIKKVNNILMPIVIILMLVVTIFNIIFYKNSSQIAFIKANYFKYFMLAIFYIGYNIVFSSGLIISNSQNFNNKKRRINTFLISVILVGLVFLINYTLLHNSYNVLISDLPLLMLAFNINSLMGYIFAFVLWFSILTSLISSLYLFVNNFKNKFLISAIILCFAFALSFLGFSSIINYIYPIQGVISLIFILKVFMFNRQKINKPKNIL